MKFLRIFFVGGLLIAGCVSAFRLYQHFDAKAALPILGNAPSYTLLNQNKEQTASTAWFGNVVIADFVFTNCAGPCPMMSAQIEDFQEKMKANRDIKFVSFTVDPENDTPEVLTEYGKRFHADFSRWSFLTGSKSAMYQTIRNGFHLALDSDSNSVTHSTKFVLLDKQERIRGYYDSEDSTSASTLMADALTLEKE